MFWEEKFELNLTLIQAKLQYIKPNSDFFFFFHLGGI